MIRFLLLFSSIASLLVLSWGMTRLFSPINCINSSLVRKVVILPSHEEVRECNFESRLFDSAVPLDVVEYKILERIQRLDSILTFLDIENTNITVKIIKDQKNIFSFQNDQLLLSADMLKSEGYLERGLLFYGMSQQNPMASAVITDFLWQELIDHSHTETPQAWVSYLKSLKGYCLSSHVLIPHIDFCQTHVELSDSSIVDSDFSTESVPWSMAPLYTQILWSVYKSSTISEKKSMLEHLMFLGDLDEAIFENRLLGRDPKKFEDSYFATVRDWLMPTLISEEQLNVKLKTFSLTQSPRFNYILVGRTSRDYFPTDLNFSDQIPIVEPLMVQFGTYQYFSPSDVKFKFQKEKIFQQNLVRNFIYVSCDMPEVSSLLEFYSYTSKIIFIRQCNDEDMDWIDFQKVGLNEYIKQHEKVEFIEFNLSALKLASRLRGPLKDSGNFTAWQRWLLWQKIISDEDHHIKRPISAIDGVERYRMF